MKNCTLLLLLLWRFSVTAQDTLSDGQIREVVVTGQFAPTDSRATVLPVRIITRDRIDRLGANNLEQLLRQEMNLRISQDLVLGSSIAIQGLSGQNVKIMIDGIAVVGRTNGNIDLGQINLANIERVEIIEGPAAVFYGTDALAGVINLISKRGQAERWKTSILGQYEQIGEKTISLEAGIKTGTRGLLTISGGADQFDGYDSSTTARNLLWNPKNQVYGNAGFRYLVGKTQVIRLKGSFFDETIENLGDIRRPQFKPYAFDDNYRTLRREVALLQEGVIAKKYFWNNALGANYFYRKKETLRTELESGEQNPVIGEQDTTRFSSFTWRSVLASNSNTARWQWLGGFDLRYDRIWGQRIRDTFYQQSGESAMGDAALIGSLRYRPFAHAVAEAGLRAVHNNRFGQTLIPSLHIKYRFSELLESSASYARGFRSPDLKELFFYFIDASHYVIGNPELQPEKSDNIQINLRRQAKAVLSPGNWGISWSLNGFFNLIKDKIDLYEFVRTPTGIVPVQGDTSTQQYAYFNIDQYKTHGLNLRAAVEHRGVRLEAAANITGHYNPYAQDYPATPAFTYTREFSTALQWTHRSWNAGCWWRTNDRFIRYYPEIVGAETQIGQRTISGYSNIDLSAGKSFWAKRITLQAGIRNLLNIQSAAITGAGGGGHSTDNSSVSPGRSFWLTVRCSAFSKGYGLKH